MAREPEPANSYLLPVDEPDEIIGGVPFFTSRRKAEDLPRIKPEMTGSARGYGVTPRRATASKELEPKAPRGVRVVALDGWQSGFRWGVVATVGGVCLMVALAVGMLK